MDKKELKEMAKNYSGVKQEQQAWLAGFQRACELLNKHIQEDVYPDYLAFTEELSEVALIDMSSIELDQKINSYVRHKQNIR